MTDPIIKTLGDLVIAGWPPQDIVCSFARFSEHRDSLSAELTVTTSAGTLGWWRINLATASGRREVVRELEEAHPIEGWRPMLNRACQLVAVHLRTGEPARELVAQPASAAAYLVTPWVPKGEITVLYGPGGTAKSLFTLATVLSGLMGHTLGSPWSVGTIGTALYLDWEADHGAHGQRIRKLLHGIEGLPAGRLYHRRLRRPLADVVTDVRTEACRLSVDLVVLDSLGAASGPEPETAGAALGTLQALGSLPGTKLVVAHESKAALEQAQGKPFGSIYVENTARSTIEMRPQESLDASTLTVTLRHAKHNDGPRAAPVGITFTFDPDSILLARTQADPTTHSLTRRLLDALADHLGRGATPLAKELGTSPGSVRSLLGRLEGRNKVLRLPAQKGEEVLWIRGHD